MSDFLRIIATAVQNGDRQLTTQKVDEALEAGMAPEEILNQGLIPGIQALGQLFKDGEAYLPEILISTRAMTRGVDRLKPLLGSTDIQDKGNIVLGTVEGDMHDIGKNLVKLMLESNGYRVHDLGVDVPAGSFAAAARDLSPDIVAVSALLTSTMPLIKNIVEALEEAGLRHKVKVLIGGAPITGSKRYPIL